MLTPPSLAVHRRGVHGDVSIVLLHGFTQNSRCWSPFDDLLSTDHEIVAIDLPGHGDSAAIVSDLEGAAQLVAAVIEPSIVVGYSMGGRIALHLALARPDLVRGLVLIGATAGIDDPHERAARRDADDRLADHLTAIGLDAFLDEWLAQPLFAGLDDRSAHRDARRHNTTAGLDASLRLAGTGTQEPLWDRIGVLDMPVLVMAGSDDAKFSEIGARLVTSIGSNATMVSVDRAGHSAHLERPEDCVRAIRDWWTAINRR